MLNNGKDRSNLFISSAFHILFMMLHNFIEYISCIKLILISGRALGYGCRSLFKLEFSLIDLRFPCKCLLTAKMTFL